MIRSFREKDTQRIYNREQVCRWGPDLQMAALRKLRMLNAAVSLEDLRALPGNRLEKLRGDREGQWSIRVKISGVSASSGETAGDAHEVELVDYH